MKLIYKILVPVILIALLIPLSISCTSTPSPTASPSPTVKPTATAPTTTAPAQVIRWKGQSSYPSVVPYGPFNQRTAGLPAMYKNWSEWLAKATNGRLLIDWVEPGAVFPIGDADKAIADGTLQIALSSGLYYRGRFPEGDIEGGGVFFWDSDSEVYDAYYNWGLFDALQKLYREKLNLIFYPCFGDSQTGIGVSFDAPNPEALRGKKIRAVGVQGDYMVALGASPAIIPLGETYQALKLGTVDGWIAGAANLEASKWKEVTKGWIPDPIIATVPSNMIINVTAFNALPKDIQDIIQGQHMYASFTSGAFWRNQNNYALDRAVAEFGVKIWNWSAADQAKAKDAVIKTVWPKMRAASPGSAQLMDIVMKQRAAWGRPTG